MSKLKYIITHGGQAHVDETLACAILIGTHQSLPLFRRDPLEEELEDPDVFVLDVGGDYNPHKKNFDHHQGGKDVEGKTSLRLLLEHTFPNDPLDSAMEWLKTVDKMDNLGPAAVAKDNGLEIGQLFSAQTNPIGQMIVRLFSKRDFHGRGEHLYHVLEDLGKMLIQQITSFRSRQEHLARKTRTVDVKNVSVLVYEGCGEKNPQEGLPQFIKEVPNTGISITPNPRGGISMFRVDDHPRVDFHRLQGEQGINFIHSNGFLAVLGEGDCQKGEPAGLWERALSLVEKAID